MQYYRQNASRIAAANRLWAFNGAIDEAEALDKRSGKSLMGSLAQSIERNTIYYDGKHDPYRYEGYFNLIHSALNVHDSQIIRYLSLSGLDTKKLEVALDKYWSVRSRLDQTYFANRSKKNISASAAQALYRLIEEWEIARCAATVALNRGPQRVGCCPGLETRILKEIGFTEASKKHPYSISAAVSSQISGFKNCKAVPKTSTTGGGSTSTTGEITGGLVFDPYAATGGGSATGVSPGWMDAGPVKKEDARDLYVPLPEPPPSESGVSPVLIFGGLAVAAFAVVMVMNKKKSPSLIA